MEHRKKREYLIQYLLNENIHDSMNVIPQSDSEQRILLRGLLNTRMPAPVSPSFLEVQDAYLQEELRQRGITRFEDLRPIQQGIYLWQGDITTLKCGAIVNAANSQMLGCFCPNHGCIDNAIHTYAGVQLRLECAEMMNAQGTAEPIGGAKITRAYNLPCQYVLHTVSPIVQGRVTGTNKKLFASCYQSCLEAAEKHALKSIAFCCISTGEFQFPNRLAAETAIQAVKEYKAQTRSEIEVIFNVFKETDYNIYRELLGTD